MAITKGEILDHLDSIDTHDRESLEIYIAECEEFYQMDRELINSPTALQGYYRMNSIDHVLDHHMRQLEITDLTYDIAQMILDTL